MSWGKWILAAGLAYVAWSAWTGISDAMNRANDSMGGGDGS